MRNMACSASPKGIAAIVGVGPNLGRSIARKFAHEGYTVAILARDLGRLSRFADEIAREEKTQVFAIRIDCSDSRSVREAFEGVLSLGFVEVLVYNAYQTVPWNPTNFTDIRIESFEKSLAVNTVGPFHCAQQVIPGCGKFALRALSQCLAKEFQPLGIHVAHIIIDGIVGAPRSSSSTSQREQQSDLGDDSMDPDALAQTYWHLHIQDRSAWSQEIDVRSSNCRYF
ncbi:hypothetical protein AQUCO_00700581v1 [Aquilegia coerulea]|uniref:Uncharacterized protein n=1 Tax=Aquilegia coerulea TaxID=218851 RepID=A0A2G5EKX3_AQUCA|nr:hypothetical protein AQUCO_00700581v1 [Aquilegia coerulea]